VTAPTSSVPASAADPLLRLEGITKSFRQRGGDVHAVRGVDLTVERNETVALVGESGCGKSTLGRIVAGLADATDGRVWLEGRDPAELDARDRYRRVQMVFQHPKQSLNPRFTVERTLDEPLRFLGGHGASARSARIDELVRQVGLDRGMRRRRPDRLSGGQQQRVAIARALASEPDLLVLDEPTSALDQSVRVLIMDLLAEIQVDRRVSYLLITHDLASARLVAHRAAVMYLGRLVETGPAELVFGDPVHPYTKALLAAAPALDPAQRGRVAVLRGETPDPRQIAEGCPFADRCPLVQPSCRVGVIELESTDDGRLVACPVVLGSARRDPLPPPATTTEEP
jgi:oligopeptide/dipeptide ABC transporter ATP-binding protein